MKQWKSVEKFKGLYSVSTDGEVRSNRKQKLLKLEQTKENKYRRVTFSMNGNTTRFSVHRLVALHFIPNPNNKPHVNHIDNDGTNNSVSNLEWCTHSENMIHAQKQGRLFNSQSRAGLRAGVVLGARALKRYETMIGNIYGDWKFKELTSKRGYEYRGKFTCLKCNNDFDRSISSVINKKTKSCNSCSKIKVKI